MTDTTLTIVDADSHITEPPDVWTARVPEKYAGVVPRVEVHPETGHRHWRVGDVWYWPVAGGMTSQAGWGDYLPASPWEYDEADPAVYKADERLRRMDEYGLDIQIVYPNIVGFISAALMPLGLDIATMCVRTYNDFILEWCSADSRRLVPMAALPFWDVDSSVVEIERCLNLGFKGILWANKFERLDMPSFVSSHWDRVYAAAQDADVPVNFHVGFGALEDRMREDSEWGEKRGKTSPEERRQFATETGVASNEILGQLLVSGLCDRFPRLKLVNVETGFGHIPYYLESVDWRWRNYGNLGSTPLLPSEYFRRQCYGTYWFERSTLRDLDLYPDNFMFSTDFPHGTGLGPGPYNGTTLKPYEYAAEGHGSLDPELRRKALSGNAAFVYKLDLQETTRRNA